VLRCAASSADCQESLESASNAVPNNSRMLLTAPNLDAIVVPRAAARRTVLFRQPCVPSRILPTDSHGGDNWGYVEKLSSARPSRGAAYRGPKRRATRDALGVHVIAPYVDTPRTAPRALRA